MREANRAPVANPYPGKGHRVPQAWGLSPGAWIHTLSQTGVAGVDLRGTSPAYLWLVGWH